MIGPIIAAFFAGPPAPPAPPPPAPPSVGTPATLRSGSISNVDYPAGAIRAGEQGSTRILLDIAAYGGVTNCTVTQTSSSELLDITTCAIARQRFKFEPARDRRGRRVASTYSQPVRWVLPEGGEVEMADLAEMLPMFGAGEMRLAFAQDNMGARCALEFSGAAFTSAEAIICPAHMRVNLRELMADTNAVLTVAILTPDGEERVPRPPIRGSLLGRVVSDLEIRADGHVETCRDVTSTGSPGGAFPSFCRATNVPYPAFRPDPEGRARRGRVEIEVYRLGAPET